MTKPNILLQDMLSPHLRRGPLARLVHQTNSHDALLQLVRSLLPEQYASHCIAASLRGRVLSIVADSSAWANRFRFEENNIKKQCRQFSDLARVESIRFRAASKLRHSLDKSQEEVEIPPAEAVPPETVELVVRLADSIEYLPLKRSLLNLANALRNRGQARQ